MYRDNETAPFVTKNLAVNLSNYLVNIYLLFNIPRKSETYYQIICFLQKTLPRISFVANEVARAI